MALKRNELDGAWSLVGAQNLSLGAACPISDGSVLRPQEEPTSQCVLNPLFSINSTKHSGDDLFNRMSDNYFPIEQGVSEEENF